MIIFHRLSLQDFDYKIPPSLGQVERKCYDLDLWPKTWFKVTTCPLPTGTLWVKFDSDKAGMGVGGMNNGQPSCIKLQTDRQTVGEYTSNHKAPAEHNTHLHFLYCIVGLKSNIGVMSMDKNMKWYWIPYFILLNITSGFIQFGSLICVLTFLSHKFLESPSVVPLHAWLTNITCQIKV